MVFDAEAAARFLFDDDFGDEEGEEDRDDDLFSLDFLKGLCISSFFHSPQPAYLRTCLL